MYTNKRYTNIVIMVQTDICSYDDFSFKSFRFLDIPTKNDILRYSNENHLTSWWCTSVYKMKLILAKLNLAFFSIIPNISEVDIQIQIISFVDQLKRAILNVHIELLRLRGSPSKRYQQTTVKNETRCLNWWE